MGSSVFFRIEISLPGKYLFMDNKNTFSKDLPGLLKPFFPFGIQSFQNAGSIS